MYMHLFMLEIVCVQMKSVTFNRFFLSIKHFKKYRVKCNQLENLWTNSHFFIISYEYRSDAYHTIFI